MPSPSELVALRDTLRRAGIEVAHYAPGRLRLRVARIKVDAPFASQLRSRLAAVPGVLGVTLRPLTGSVLIEFAPDALAAAGAREALIEALTALFPGLDGERLGRWLADF